MHFKTLGILSSILLLLACSSRDNNADLLSTPATSTDPIVGEELLHYRKLLESQTGTSNIALVIANIWGEKHPLAKTTLSSIEEHRKSDHTLYVITLIFDDVPGDDSISGYRYDTKITNSNGRFEFAKLEESWRCWPDRGRRTFSTEPCV